MQHTVRFFTSQDVKLCTLEMNHIPKKESNILLPRDNTPRRVLSFVTNLKDETIDVIVTGEPYEEIPPCPPPKSAIALWLDLFRQIKNLRNAW